LSRFAKLIFRTGPYNGKSITLPVGKSLTMGRNRDLELPLPDLKLSRRHCQVNSNGDLFFLKDLGSTNGTFLNGARIEGEVELNDFDRIVLGDTEIEFHVVDKMPLPNAFDASAPDPEFTDLPDLMQAVAEPPPPPPPPPAPPKKLTPPPAPKQKVDPFEAALQEMLMPLPPEPPPLRMSPGGAFVGEKPKIVFCEQCSSSIPMLDADLGLAHEINGTLLCKECVAKSSQRAPAYEANAKKSKSLSDILSALDDEAVVIDDLPARRSPPK